MKRLVSLLFFMILLSCDTTFESSIPPWPVFLELDLTYEDRDLKGIQAYRIYKQGVNTNQAVERTGFGGVLVYHGLSSEGSSETYYAFDAACPVEVQQNTTVTVDSTTIYAVCPKCGSKYEILNGIGNPVEGPAKESLKRYPVDKQGEKIYIRY